jgi:antirestriction protein ArdC
MSKVHNVISEILISKIQAAIESGEALPWRKTWSGASYNAPSNMVTGNKYRGINNLLLSIAPFGSEHWMTYKQITAKGGSIIKGSEYTPVIFFKWFKPKGAGSDESMVPMLRFYKVWNIEQTTGIDYSKPEPEVLQDHERIARAEAIVSGYIAKPGLEHARDNQPCYMPGSDRVLMPEMGQFETPENYYSVLFHELTHSTGHENRLARKTLTDLNRFGSHSYSREELVAELGAAMLCQEAKISNEDTISLSASYLQSWIKALKDDVKMAVIAGQQAQKAADHILNIKPEYAEAS